MPSWYHDASKLFAPTPPGLDGMPLPPPPALVFVARLLFFCVLGGKKESSSTPIAVYF